MEVFRIIYVTASIFMVFTVDRFMKVFFEKRKTPFFVYLLSFMLYLIIVNVAFFSSYLPIINLLTNISMIFLITLNYESTMKRKISAVCFIYLFMFITDILISSLVGNFNISPLTQVKGDFTFGLIIMNFLLFFEAILAQNFKNIRKNNPVSNIFWISSFTIPASSIFIAVTILNSMNTSQIIKVISIVVIFLINILTFYLHDSLSAAYADKLNATIYEQEKEYYYNQCELMRESMEDLKSFRHDVKSHLSTVSDYIKYNQSGEAEKYLFTLIGEVGDYPIYSDTGNTAFDSIINYKLRNAKEKNINLQINIAVPPKLNIDVSDVVAIVGNLLDNSVNAALKTEEKKIFLNIYFSKGRIIINIENTFNGEVKYENGEIVSSSEAKEHGYGLKNIRRSIEKYKGYMEINHTDSLFFTNVLLYVQSS